MKKAITTNILILVLLLSFTSVFASGQNEKEYSKVENNLLVGLNTDNQGLQLSSAYYLGEIKSDKAIIPLMSVLHNSKSDASRQAAALALYKIDSPRGMHAIKKAITFDDNEQTRRLCKILYNKQLSKVRS